MFLNKKFFTLKIKIKSFANKFSIKKYFRLPSSLTSDLMDILIGLWLI